MICNLLFESDNVEYSVNAVLMFLGNYMQVDRCYVLKSFDEGESFKITHEWCGTDIKPNINKYDEISKDVFADVFEKSEEHGYSACDDLTLGDSHWGGRDDVRSYIQTQIRNNGKVTHVLGVEISQESRKWLPVETNSIVFVLKLLLIFLKNK